MTMARTKETMRRDGGGRVRGRSGERAGEPYPRDNRVRESRDARPRNPRDERTRENLRLETDENEERLRKERAGREARLRETLLKQIAGR
ncbi:hypothetical protein BGX24_008160, partial [Mortierella sp. AD032]